MVSLILMLFSEAQSVGSFRILWNESNLVVAEDDLLLVLNPNDIFLHFRERYKKAKCHFYFIFEINV